jgi:hypothetical protein
MLYSRGIGLFAFLLLNLLLWIVVVVVLVRAFVRRFEWRALSPFLSFAVVFSFLLCAHLALGVSSGVDVLIVLGYNGLLNVLNMVLFLVLLLFALRNEAGRC